MTKPRRFEETKKPRDAGAERGRTTNGGGGKLPAQILKLEDNLRRNKIGLAQFIHWAREPAEYFTVRFPCFAAQFVFTATFTDKLILANQMNYGIGLRKKKN